MASLNEDNGLDILGWTPSRWDQVVGNRRAKRLLRNTLKGLRRQMAADEPGEFKRTRLLITGAWRSGKSAMVELLGRSLMCRQLDPSTLDPCPRQCLFCQGDFARHRQSDTTYLISRDGGVFAERLARFIPVDYSRIETPQDLQGVVDPLVRQHQPQEEVVIVFLDEVHRVLEKPGMDDVMLRCVERTPFVWILATAEPDALEQPLKNRLIEISTELPSTEELIVWLRRLCDDWGIRWESLAVHRVAAKSNNVPGIALKCLAIAALDPDEGLSLEVAEDWIP